MPSLVSRTGMDDDAMVSGSSDDRVLLGAALAVSGVRDETSAAPATAAAFRNRARRPMVGVVLF